MRNKRIISIGTIILLINICMTGCSETDEGVQLFGQVQIEDKVGISQIEYPETVKVYETTSWYKSKEEIADVLLQGERTELFETKNSSYVHHWSIETEYDSYKERLSGTSEKEDMERLLSVKYGIYTKEDLLVSVAEHSKEQSILDDKVQVKLSDSREKGDKEAEEIVRQYFTSLEFPQYEIRSSKKVASKTENAVFWKMYWQQVVDGIPVSSLTFEENSRLTGTEVYNREKFNYDIKQYNNTIITEVINGELVALVMWEGAPVQVKTEIGNYEVISPKQAYKEALKYYKTKKSEEHPRLEVLELQYKNIEKEGRLLLVPVWTVGIFAEQQNERWGNSDLCYYYLIDAVSGELFLDVNY